MIHSRKSRNVDLIIKVQPSRFRKILSDIRGRNGLEVEGFVDRVCRQYNYFSFMSSDIGDKNGNKYTIIKDYEIPDEFKKCSVCDCLMKRWVNGKTGICFYKEDCTSNYTTKIPE